MDAHDRRQVYRSWDEAMSDPELDLSAPWFVVPDSAPAFELPRPSPVPEFQLPDGWTDVGATEG